jgi:hypothetical protein
VLDNSRKCPAQWPYQGAAEGLAQLAGGLIFGLGWFETCRRLKRVAGTLAADVLFNSSWYEERARDIDLNSCTVANSERSSGSRAASFDP